VDLPRVIEGSSYYENVIQMARAGDTSRRSITRLERYLEGNDDKIWDNSWVRFPAAVLSPYAADVFDRDLRAHKADPNAGTRADRERFFLTSRGETFIRVPISYLIKLALADSLFFRGEPAQPLRETAEAMMDHLLSDNTSPETYSFHVSALRPERGNGRAIARETATRFLFSQLLVMYGNDKFKLKKNGQEALIYFSPHPPARQNVLNDSISDSFYRELFMSPCLSGWDRGEEKHEYMHLCHRVLSRSHLNAVNKMRDARIITNNLIVLPNTSNTSLSHNGIHVSLGSRRVSEARRAGRLTPAQEKYAGDLVIKLFEHFLPLFVGTYTAAPYRIDYRNFHPEKVLGFLPHELHYTHLRMLWQRWKRKARNTVFGHSFTGFGPVPLDKTLAALLRLRGDFVPDLRLVNYLACVLSTERSPALNGELGNTARLMEDLDRLGIFHRHMSLYLLVKLREFDRVGFSGVEGRYYSLFPSFRGDMSPAVDLQLLITALAYKYILNGTWHHRHIPDTPFCESERRQIFFGAAVGNTAFYVRKNTTNRFLREILTQVRDVRGSSRYPGFLTVKQTAYQRGLLALLRRDAADLVDIMRLKETLNDLEERTACPRERSVTAKLTKGIMGKAGKKKAFAVNEPAFNRAAEQYYREDLRCRHLREALDYLREDVREWGQSGRRVGEDEQALLRSLLDDQSPLGFLELVEEDLLRDTLSLKRLVKLIHLMIIVERIDRAGESEYTSSSVRFPE